jgi:hypothetical protein
MSYEFTAPVKDPSAVLRHGFDWSDWLIEGETITGTPTVTAAPSGLTIDQVDEDAGVVSYRVSGGALGQEYTVTCTISTVLGGSPYRTDQRSILYRVGER